MSSSHDEAPPPRITRPEPERTGPIRQWSTLFGAAAAASGAGADARGRGEERAGAARAGADDGPGSLGDVVSRSVELGYRVVEEYLRQGERAARQLGAGRLDAGLLAGEATDLAGRMTRYASDALALWLDFAAAAGPRGPAGARDGGAEHSAPSGAPGAEQGSTSSAAGAAQTPASNAAAAPEMARVRVELEVARPAEVAVDLRTEAFGRPLLVHALRGLDPELPRIDAVTLECDGPGLPLVLRIRIPADHPAGTYNGLVVDEASSRPVGTVSVRLGAVA